MKLIQRSPVIAFVVALWTFSQSAETIHMKFSKVECDTYNPSLASFRYCYLKALARHSVSLDLYVDLHQLPYSNITLNAQFLRKGIGYNGYRPYLYNDTMDFCKFLKRPSSYMFWKIVFGELKPFTNLNHTCPINHDIIIKGFILNGDQLKLIPFPADDFMLRMKFSIFNEYKFEIRSYISVYN